MNNSGLKLRQFLKSVFMSVMYYHNDFIRSGFPFFNCVVLRKADLNDYEKNIS